MYIGTLGVPDNFSKVDHKIGQSMFFLRFGDDVASEPLLGEGLAGVPFSLSDDFFAKQRNIYPPLYWTILNGS